MPAGGVAAPVTVTVAFPDVRVETEMTEVVTVPMDVVGVGMTVESVVSVVVAIYVVISGIVLVTVVL